MGSALPHLRASGEFVELVHRLDLGHLDLVASARGEPTIHRRRMDGMHVDTTRTALHGKRGGERGDGGLGGSVHDRERVWDVRSCQCTGCESLAGGIRGSKHKQRDGSPRAMRWERSGARLDG